ncbi:hypothetical protein DIPPA_30480 [Diplonema papillatum]|nr:hypothetical protein DIPPA_30480 [Diplonema papillatum]
MRTMLLAAAVLATMVSADVTGPWRVTEEVFQEFMREEGREPLYRWEDFGTQRMKVIKRFTAWAADNLKDESSIYNVMTWIGRKAGIVTGTTVQEDLESLAASNTPAEFVTKAQAAAKKYSAIMKRGATFGKEPEDFVPINGAENPYPYWGFIPKLKGRAMGSGSATWENIGCKSNTATSTWNSDKTVMTIELSADQCDPSHSGDVYLFITVDGFLLEKLSADKPKKTVHWLVPAEFKKSIHYDAETKGVRIMGFLHDEGQLMIDVLESLLMFLQPEAGSYPDFPSEEAMMRNIYFLTNYQRLQPFMKARVHKNITEINPDLVQSGDFIGVIRLDGLDPMLGWAMGSATGHTTVAMRDPSGALFITESTTNSSYWPTNGIQRTPFDLWMKQALAAGYNAVWAPMDPVVRAKLNQTAMWEFFYENEGFQYGYQNMLWGWVDTVENNYPCTPVDGFTQCLTWDIIEVLFSVVGGAWPLAGELIWDQSWNKRLNTTGLPPDDLYMYAETQLNMSSSIIPTIVEEDSWLYNTSRNWKPAVGKSMVCCVFVCNMWKAGGLFDGKTVNCAEMTNVDDYDQAIFNKAMMNGGRPEVCQTYDPENENCQMVGPFTLNLNSYNKAPLYDHQCEHCPSWQRGVGPDYWPAGKQNATC